MPDTENKNSELKEAFIHHLPERVASINDTWHRLCKKKWDREKSERLYQRLQDLAGSCGKFGLISVSDSVLSLDVFLSSFVESDTPPKKKQQAKADKLFREVIRSIEQAQASGLGTPPKGWLGTLFFLRSSPTEDLAPGLSMALESSGWEVLSFATADDLEGEIQKRLPKAIIIEAKLIGPFRVTKRELDNQMERHNKAVPIICISTSRDMRHRLEAHRLGAEGYFTTPVDAKRVAAKVAQLTIPADESYRILVVEDDPSQARFASSILEKAGMKTQAVTDPLKVLDALDRFRPDLILMDLYMPGADGAELTTIIREQPEFIGTPIVFLSGEEDTDKQLDALSVGGDDFLSKPIRPKFLINTVTNRVKRTRELSQHIIPRSQRDNVSGLYKRRVFFEELDGLLAASHQYAPTGGILFLELDNLHDLYQQLGAGDADDLLGTIGTLITDQVESQDIAARFGDDTFVIIARRPHARDLTDLAEKLFSRIEQNNFNLAAEISKPRASIGICPFSEDPNDAAALIAHAEQACEKAHQLSAKRIHLFSKADEPEASESEEQEVSSLVRKALERGSFQVLFPPLVDLHNGGGKTHEMVLRLPTTGGGHLTPEQIEKAASVMGVADTIDRLQVDRGLTVLQERRSGGYELTLFITQSAENVQSEDILNWLQQQLRSRHLVGTGLVFEFNIARLSSNLQASKRHLMALQSMGIGISLTHFSGNPAAMKVLQLFNADYVKAAPALLRVEESLIDQIAEQVHKLGKKIILPRSVDAPSFNKHWLSVADYVPENLAQ
jgi:diguanylate cyclase (GGDEF)-like protein